MTPKQRLARVIYGVFIVIVAAFVISNIWQVAYVLFVAEPASEADASRTPKVTGACKAAIAEEMSSIAAAAEIASREPDGDTARSRYMKERRGNTRSPGAACTSDPHGTEAMAALERLDRASQAHTVRDATELRAVRLSAQSFISGPQ